MKAIKKWYNKWFQKKVIVYSATYMPAKFVKHVVRKADKKRFVRVKFTNRMSADKVIPLTDIPFDDVVYIRVFTWPWYEKLCRRFNWKVPEQKIWYNKDKKEKTQP